VRGEVFVGELPSVPANRLRRPSWRDPRLAVGVGLVLLSVVLGARVVAAADDTQPAWAAAHTLTPGDPVGPEDVQAVQVRMDGDSRAYLPATGDLPEGLVALRGVGTGELLPPSGVGEVEGVEVRPVGIPVSSALPAGLRKGARVDVWVAEPDVERAGSFSQPRRLVAAAEVAEVNEGGGALGTGNSTTVQVLVGEQELPEALAALANGADVSLVLLPGAGSRDS
jgi:hypothetical protein